MITTPARTAAGVPLPNTPMTTATRRVNVPGLASRFNSGAFTLQEILQKSCVTDEQGRENMTPKERTAFHAVVVKGLDTKFTIRNDLSILQDGTTTSDFMEKNLSFTLQVSALQHYLESKCLQSVFSILNIDPLAPFSLADENTVYLLQDYSSLTLDQVLLSSEFYYKFSKKQLDQENLEWTMDLLLNSCDLELQKIVQSKLLMLPRTQRGGPTTFMLIVTQIIHSNDNISRALTSRLDHYKVTSVPGENIETVVSYINAICDRLDCCGKLPHDIEKMILTILDSCTVPKFTNHFSTLRTIESRKIADYHGVLREGTRYYLQLVHDGDWFPSVKPGSAFSAAAPTQLPRQGATQDRTHDRKGNLIDRVAPPSGSPAIRTNSSGSTESWCKECNRWGSHPTAEHDAWKLRQKEFRKRVKANAAAVTPAPSDSSVPPPPVESGAPAPSVPPPSANLAVVSRLLRGDV